MGHGRGNAMDEAAVAHLPSKAWWLFSCLVTSVLARVLAGPRWSQTLSSPEDAASAEALWAAASAFRNALHHDPALPGDGL